MLTIAKPPLWKQQLRCNFVNIAKLADFLQLTPEQRKQLSLLSKKFPLNVPLRLAAKMEKGSLEDPLFRQFVPLVQEEERSDGFSPDPVGDQCARKAEKLLHKYEGRVLLICTSACAMHCRYCFRQNFAYDSQDKTFEKEIDLIASDASIKEVILSGGDPLSLDNAILSRLLHALASIAHVKKVRFHTRFPIGIPERIDESFCSLLASLPLQFWFVLHINHPRELDDEVLSALKKLQRLGIPLLNQCVLLKGVNDSFDVLHELSQHLTDNGIIPYYMHQLDRVQGAAHFEVAQEEGLALIEALRKSLPGYGVPRYVQEIAGMPSKTPIF